MKNIVSLLLIILFFGCGIFSSINPPKWIIGSWEDASGTMTFTFTSNNMVITSKISDPLDYKESYNRNEIVENIKNNGIYEFTAFIVFEEYGIDIKHTYRFVLQSSNSLRFYLITNKKDNSPTVLFKK